MVDSDYGREVDVILFSFGEEDFEVKLGDASAQLGSKSMRTPETEEVNSLDQTGRGNKGYGRTGIQSIQQTMSIQFESLSAIQHRINYQRR